MPYGELFILHPDTHLILHSSNFRSGFQHFSFFKRKIPPPVDSMDNNKQISLIGRCDLNAGGVL